MKDAIQLSVFGIFGILVVSMFLQGYYVGIPAIAVGVFLGYMAGAVSSKEPSNGHKNPAGTQSERDY